MSTPPTPDALLEMMRRMLIENPEQNAIIFLGAAGQKVAMPCGNEHPVDALATLAQAVDRNILPRPDWIAVLADSYALTVKTEDMPVMRPGLLAELFAAGDPRVKESIIVHCVAPDGPSYSAQQKYTKTADGIDWDKPDDLPIEEISGAIPNGMRRVLGMESVTR